MTARAHAGLEEMMWQRLEQPTFSALWAPVNAGFTDQSFWVFGPANPSADPSFYPVHRNDNHVLIRPFTRTRVAGLRPGYVRYIFLGDPARLDVRVLCAIVVSTNPGPGNPHDEVSAFVFPGLGLESAINVARQNEPLHRVDHATIRVRKSGRTEIYTSPPRDTSGRKQRLGPKRSFTRNPDGGVPLGTILSSAAHELDAAGHAMTPATPGLRKSPFLNRAGIEEALGGKHLVHLLNPDKGWPADHYLAANLHLVPRHPGDRIRLQHPPTNFPGYGTPAINSLHERGIATLDMGQWVLAADINIIQGKAPRLDRHDGTWEARGGYAYRHI